MFEIVLMANTARMAETRRFEVVLMVNTARMAET